MMKRGLCEIKLLKPTPIHFKCNCDLHENNDHYVSERLVQNCIEKWKQEIESTLCLPNMKDTICLYDRLYDIRNLIKSDTLHVHLNEWARGWMNARKQFYTECSNAFSLCLTRTVFGRHFYLRKLLLHTYRKESGAYRFRKWIAFLLGAVRMDEREKHIKRFKL